MIAEGIAKFEEIVKRSFTVQQVEHAGLTYADKALTRIPDELPVNKIDPLEVSTLSALMQYLKADPDGLYTDEHGPIVHVVDPTHVEVVTRALGESQRRQTWLRATALVPRLLTSEAGSSEAKWPIEDMSVHVRTCFVDSPSKVDEDGDEVTEVSETARAALVRFLGTWVQTDQIEAADDGVTQTVTVRSGISLNNQGKAPNLMDLRPIRTFHEIEQPSSPFVLRCYKGGIASLTTADGGAWRLKAIDAIRAHLSYRLPEGTRLIY